jgi:peptidyl-prolyl cis-trans isomerase SurA
MRFRVLCLGLLSMSCLLALPAAGDTVIEEIIARVNNQIVTRSEFLRSKDQLKAEIRQQDAQNADKIWSDKERDVLRDISADTDLIKRLDEMRKQMNLESMEDLEKAATAQGVSFEDYKLNMKNTIITQKVIGREVGSRMNITKEETQKFYDEHKSELTQPEQVRLSEILVPTQKLSADGKTQIDMDEAAIAAAETRAKDVLEQIKKGAGFEEIAKKESQGPTAAQGGDLGLFQRGTLAKELDDKVFAMKAGEVTDVIRTKQGFVILKVADHQQPGTPLLKDVENRIMNFIYEEKLQPALRAYLTKLREDAFIEIKPGYVDTGASPNQTKFIQTTSADVTAKELKKKRKKKLGVL